MLLTPTSPHPLTANTPLLLDDPTQGWEVLSGTVAVFAVPLQQQQPTGQRRYLFTVSAGEALFGAPLPASSPGEQSQDQPGGQAVLGLLAVALESAMVRPFPFRADDETCPRTVLIPWLDGWIHHLGQIEALPVPPRPGAVPETHYLSLTPGQVCVSGPSQVLWVRLQEGTATWMGRLDWPVVSELGCFPIGHGMFLEAAGNIQFFARDSYTVRNRVVLVKGLAQLHRYLFELLEQIATAQEAETGQRLQQRIQLNRLVTQQVVERLAGVLTPDLPHAEGQEPLLVAAGAVGKALGVTIKPPSKGENMTRLKEPLEAVARASQLQLRRVLLRGDCWQQDSGPLLAYTRVDQRPVALLPQGAKHYHLLPGDDPSPQPVTAALAATLDPTAYVFYRPLPDQPTAWNLMRFMFHQQGRDWAAILVAGVAATLLGMLIPQATSVLVDQVIPFGDTPRLGHLGLGLLGAALGATSFQLVQAIATLRVETASEADLQAAVWDRLLKLRPSFFRQYAVGDLSSRVSSINAIRRKLSGSAIQGLFAGAFSLLNLGLLVVYSPPLAAVALVVALGVMAVTVVSGMMLVQKYRPLLEIQGQIYGLLVQLINGVPKLRIAGAEPRAFAQWGQRYSQQLRLTLSTQQIEDAVDVFNAVLPILTTLVLFWLASLLVGADGTGLSTGQFIAFTVAFGTFIGGATSLSNTLVSLLDVVPLWQRSRPILNAEPEVDLTKADPGALSGALSLDRVSFRYRDDGPLILDDICVTAQPGEFIALVGPSGSGKSTVMRLLLGFETPQAGSIFYDGQDLMGLDLVAVRRQLGVVLQTSRLSAGSIFENISGGALVSLDEAWTAAERAGLAADLRAMPMQMHTVVSEGGANLSGGQRQRLLIARAMARQPQIMLMDEATSALDNRTQAIVTDSLAQLNVTRVVIAHRLSTIRYADRIYVIEAGRVVQTGNFEALAAEPGLFAQLIQRQMA